MKIGKVSVIISKTNVIHLKTTNSHSKTCSIQCKYSKNPVSDSPAHATTPIPSIRPTTANVGDWIYLQLTSSIVLTQQKSSLIKLNISKAHT